jgi:hypothetical protein
MLMIDQLREAVEANADVESESTVNINYSDGTTDTITISGSGLYDSLTSTSTTSICVPCYTTGTGTCYTGGYTSIPSLTIGNLCNGTTTWATGSGGGSGYTFTGINANPATVNITTDGIDIKEGGDIKVGGHSLVAFMKTMEERLAILVPDPAKMEKFAALKKAYENYKLLEKLCQEEDKPE